MGLKFVKKTGLVPVFEPKNKDHIFGVTPATAIEGVSNGTLQLFPIPEGVETDELSDRIPESPKPPEEKKAAEIPDGWEELHHMKRIAIAQDILGVKELTPTEGMKIGEYADSVIREELYRREEAAAAPALTSAQ